MKKGYFIVFGLGVCFLINYFLQSCTTATAGSEAAIQQDFQLYTKQRVDAVALRLDSLTDLINQGSDKHQIAETFLASRILYKKIEPVVEYYFQGLTRRINGPALPDIKPEDGVVWPPHGFQKIEELIYDNEIDSVKSELLNEIQVLLTDLRFVKTNLEPQHISFRHIAEMQQHQLIRIAALGITGFDTPISFNALPEAESSLDGLLSLSGFLDKKYLSEVETHTQNAVAYLTSHDDFDSFDRLTFITDFLMPLSDAFHKMRPPVSAKDSLYVKPFKGSFTELMQGKGFNPDYYATYEMAATNKAKIELGRKLFFDASLSKLENQSCGTCHQPDRFYTDGRAKAINQVHGGNLLRNSPTLLYASLQAQQFYDLRSTTLEDQIHDVIQNKNEFDFTTEKAIERIAKDAVYQQLFKTAFNKTDITSFDLRNAIAAFVRSLNSFSSDFDRYMNGDRDALTAEQKAGFNLFTGKAKCATCHFVPVFNGTVPPEFTNSESEVIGVPQNIAWAKATISADSGRYFINPMPELMFAFKTPTVRNAARTAPYMHNGVYNTLDDVMTFYEKGGGVGIGIPLAHQTLPFDALQITASDKKAIIAFLNALTDKKVP